MCGQETLADAPLTAVIAIVNHRTPAIVSVSHLVHQVVEETLCVSLHLIPGREDAGAHP